MSFKRLNATQYDRRTIDDAVAFLERDELPDRIQNASDSTKYRFKRKWRGFIVNDGKLFYGPLEVVRDDEVADVLKAMYDDPLVGGVGRDKFYDKVKNQYLGITKEDVQKFLDNQESYQLNKPYVRNRTARPIMSKRPNQRWQMDIIILERFETKNNGYKNILTIVDTFTKFTWAKPLKSKEDPEVAEALRGVMLEAGRSPKFLQTDNGGEFKGDALKKVCRDFKITHIFSNPYAPQENGQVENMNGKIERQIRLHFTQTNTKTWIDALPEIVYKWNNTKHSTIDETPAQVEQAAQEKDVKQIDQVKRNIRKAAAKVLQAQPVLAPLKRGDMVRKSRRTTVEGRRDKFEKFDENWSREIYRVVKVQRDKATKKGRYLLETEDGKPVSGSFFRPDLQLIDATETVRDVGTKKRGVEIVRAPEDQVVVEDREGNVQQLNIGHKRKKALRASGLDAANIKPAGEKRRRGGAEQ